MSIRLRFAPSPTGRMHPGNVRTAILNYLLAKSLGGEFWLRIDDTDQERHDEGAVQFIYETLAWLGISWDHTFRQSQKTSEYENAIHCLKQSNRIYPCYETSEQLEEKRNRQQNLGLPPRYDRSTGMMQSETSEPPHWRFSLNHEEVTWKDMRLGTQHYHVSHVSDPIVVRHDGNISFLLAGVIDDISSGISHILRGVDHITNTAVQIQMFEALGAPIPQWGHLPLLSDEAGQKMSKRVPKYDIAKMREQGLHPLALSSFLVSLGGDQAPKFITALEDLIPIFQKTHYGASHTLPCSISDLWIWNTKFLRHLSWEAFCLWTQQLDFEKKDILRTLPESGWRVICSAFSDVEDLVQWTKIWTGDMEMEPLIFKEDFEIQILNSMRQYAPQLWDEKLSLEDWKEHIWNPWINAVFEITHFKKKDIFHTLRKCFMRKTEGPVLHEWIYFLGFKKTQSILESKYIA